MTIDPLFSKGKVKKVKDEFLYRAGFVFNYAAASAEAGVLKRKTTTNIFFFSLMKRSKNHRLDINYAKNELFWLNHTIPPHPVYDF